MGHRPGVGFHERDRGRGRGRTVLAVQRVEVGPGGGEVRFALGLDALGSWASGRPRALPVRVQVWAEPVLEPPAGAPTLTVSA